MAPAFDERLVMVVAHYWDNRRLARALMAGRSRQLMAKRLAGMIDQALIEQGWRSPAGALAGLALAHGQLGLIEAWLCGRRGMSAEAVARMLHAASYAATRAAALI